MNKNDNGLRFIELPQDIVDFAVNNCEVNINQMMGMIQAVHDDKIKLSQDKLIKLVEYIENFRKLKKALEVAK